MGGSVAFVLFPTGFSPEAVWAFAADEHSRTATAIKTPAMKCFCIGELLRVQKSGPLLHTARGAKLLIYLLERGIPHTLDATVVPCLRFGHREARADGCVRRAARSWLGSL